MRRSTIMYAGAVFAAALLTAAPFPADAQGSGSATLDAAKARGQVLCGIAGSGAGLLAARQPGRDARDSTRIPAVRSPPPRWATSNKVKFVATTTQNRFTALQSGEVDLLSRSTTWTLGREGNLGLEFAWVNYYDGTGFLVKKSAGVKSAKEMDGAIDLRAAGHQHRTGDQRLLPAEQHEVHPDPDPGSGRDSGRLPVRTVRCLFDRCVGAGDVPLQPGRRRRTIWCCCPRSSARSRSA